MGKSVSDIYSLSPSKQSQVLAFGDWKAGQVGTAGAIESGTYSNVNLPSLSDAWSDRQIQNTAGSVITVAKCTFTMRAEK